MLRKALVLFFVFMSMAAFVSCGKTGSHFIYAAIPAANQLAVFREDPYSGVLTQLAESPYTVGFGPESVVIHPSGKFLYVANAGQNENDVSLFDLNSDGTVTEKTPRTATGTLPFVMAMDPAGNYLYVANVASNNLSVYSINTKTNTSTNPLGQLTPVTGSPFSINLAAKNMQVSPSGKFLYISAPSQPTGLVAVFSVNAGVPRLVGSTPTPDNDPSGLAIDPKGSYLYTANANQSSISIYCIAPASCTPPGASSAPGTLTQVPQSPLADNEQHPVAVIVDPAGAFLYVANQGSGNISSYSITSGTGFPVTVTDSPFGSEAQPSFLAMDPGGKYLFVGNQATGAGIEAFGVSSGSLNTINTYSVGNTVASIAVSQ